MQPLIVAVTEHPIAVSIAAAALILLGGWLFNRSRSRTRIDVSAKSGGVIVGGNNAGSISTSSSGNSKPENSMLGSVLGIIGAILAALAVLVALFAWLYPKTPAP
jgi:hypothetical protein